MKIKQSRSDFYALYRALNALSNLRGVKFGFNISKNKEAIKPMINQIKKASESSEIFNAYDKERVELNVKHSAKDEAGNPVIENQNYKIENKEAFDAELSTLKEKHAPAIKEREDQIANMDKFMAEEIELELKPIDLSIIPQDITVGQMESLSVLIVD